MGPVVVSGGVSSGDKALESVNVSLIAADHAAECDMVCLDYGYINARSTFKRDKADHEEFTDSDRDICPPAGRNRYVAGGVRRP